MDDIAIEQELLAVLQPETVLEEQLILNPDFKEGLLWGKPRRGHPEGPVYKHIREVLDNIDQLNIPNEEREKLRIVAFAHDTFKHKEDTRHPRNWELHHSKLARKFMEGWITDPIVLDLIELHDEVYHIWRFIHLKQKPEKGLFHKKMLMQRLGDQFHLYAMFYRCDTLTGDKDPRPLEWFEQEFKMV